MSRQANGNYLQPANTAAISGQAISSSAFNALVTDIGTEITNSVDRGGRSAMTAALPMGSNKITGMADPTVATDAATKNYVDTTTATFFSTGDVKLTFKAVADAGWLIFDDGTFGSASSGSSNRANADTQSLFNLFYNSMADAWAPILTSGGGATTRAAQGTAAAAWAANCRMTLPKTLGRAISLAGTGAGLSGRPLGANTGSETNVIGQTNLPAISLPGTVTDPGHSHNLRYDAATAYGNQGVLQTAITDLATNGASGVNIATSTTGISVTTPLGGSGTALNNMQPTTFMNAMVKL